ncbi:hypothetical protein PF008_g4298 [Phytophthora fragariae]|nr:hypothetical protein PF008_g4298 [Phytophthora fragariae]
MESYVSVNGVPVIASKKLLVDLLRHDMNFSGLLVSDYSEVDRMYSEHHLVPSVADAVRVTLQETSLDMNMSPDLQDFGDTIESLVANGLITESRLDESVRRILETKRDLGLLDSGYYDEFGHDGMDADEDVGSLADQEDALKMAQESVILLENRNGTLPIDLKKTTSVFVTGPVSDNKGFQCGGWSVFWQGSIDSTLFPNGATFKEAVQSKAAGHAQVDHLEVVDIDGKVNPQDFQRGIQLAAKSDYTLVVLGERNYAEKTGDLLGSMALPAGQLWYLEELSRLNSTKWEFGHGLSYSKFEYSALWLNTTQVHATSGALEVGVTVTNRGTRPGKEVVLLFVAQKFRRASVPETKLLKAFKKLETLAPGASQDVTFVLTPEHWSYYEPHIIGSGFQRRAEPGEFVVSLLPSSTDSSTPPAPRALDDAERSSQTKTRGAPGGMASEVASAAMAAPSVSFYVVP